MIERQRKSPTVNHQCPECWICAEKDADIQSIKISGLCKNCFLARCREVKAIVELEELRDGTFVMTLRHPTHRGPWAKFKIDAGGNLLKKAIKAVYTNKDGDAVGVINEQPDAYFRASGMSDES